MPLSCLWLEGRFFTKLGLRSAYDRILILAGDEWKSAFSSTTGPHEYVLMLWSL